MSKPQQRYFTDRLIEWHHTDNSRELPWKQEKDPYKIWLSEIILQQTRAQQGLPYYLNFIAAYPTVEALADASDEEAFRLWQGLGYYNRCKNMLATARLIAGEAKGIFPESYSSLLSLKGIGPYTAAAISSFAYGLPHAVVDGNVYRILSRYFGISTPIDSSEGKKEFHTLAQTLLYEEDSSAYNQAIMDLGATVCTPAQPRCTECPVQRKCVAYNQNLIDCLPVKAKKKAVRKRYFHFLLLQTDDSLWIEKRTGKDIWQSLHQPYLIENDKPLDSDAIAETTGFRSIGISCKPVYEGAFTQKLTHQTIESRFFSCAVERTFDITLKGGKWVKYQDLKNFGFPKTVISFLEKKLYF